ncbi:MAG: hypothetical protein QOD56_3089 [Gammaproteobacteria bacterium]|nr:hypothetical protein [Gammaproteobacteria bacterium]
MEKSLRSPPAPGTRVADKGRALDVAIVITLAAGAAYVAWLATGIGDHISQLMDSKADDVWFEADVARVFGNMTDRGSDNFRSQVHPLFALIAYCLTHLFRLFPGVSNLQSVRLAIALPAALWLGGFFALLRILRCRRLDATVFSLVAATSSSAFFWVSIPETYLLGSLTIVAVLVVTALSERRPIPVWLDVGMAAAALSMLLTNWMFALISLVVRRRLTVAVQLGVNAFVAVVFLWAIQKFLFPSSHFFLGDHEKWPAVPPVLSVPPIFFLDSLVMPDIRLIANDHPWLWQKLSVQGALTWKLTYAGAVALIAWLVLLILGLYAAATLPQLKKFRIVLGLSIAGQLALHLVYGNESFLYALNWLPLLVTAAALATLTRLRWISVGVAVIFVVSAAIHNFHELKFALDYVAHAGS